jgi:simple sugar transport system permease protein
MQVELVAGIGIAFVAQVLRISVPYALAAVGGAFSERGGVVNIALEGILLAGAFGGAVVSLSTGHPWLGVVAGVGAGVALAALHAAVTVLGKADQILSGLALNLLALGATRGLLKVVYESASNSPRVEGIAPLAASTGGAWSLLTHPLFLLAVLAVLIAHRVLFRSSFGLSLRAAGDGPRALDGAGISVTRTRFLGVLLSGAFGGLGGVWLIMEQHSFTDGMSNGRGYIALAAMIVGKWRPLGAAAACLLFGAAETLQIRIPGEHLPTQLLQALPYLLTIIVLAGWIGRATPPRAVGVPYERERGEA